jgi:hypothetical protein
MSKCRRGVEREKWGCKWFSVYDLPMEKEGQLMSSRVDAGADARDEPRQGSGQHEAVYEAPAAH